MSPHPVDPSTFPLRFDPPEGWRTPDPRWTELHQGFLPPTGWKPYHDAPDIPEGWTWWVENGTSWFTFFRHRAPAPTRALGNWFSLAALGLFSIIVSPFALPGAWVFAGGALGGIFIILGIRGVIGAYRKNSESPADPYDLVRAWSDERRDAYFARKFEQLGTSSPEDRDRLVHDAYLRWWGENPEDAKS